MRKSRFQGSDIVNAISALEAGVRAEDLATMLDVRPNALRALRKRYDGMTENALARFRRLEADYACARRTITHLRKENCALRKFVAPDDLGARELAETANALHETGLPESQACAITRQSRSTLCHRRKRAWRSARAKQDSS